MQGTGEKSSMKYYYGINSVTTTLTHYCRLQSNIYNYDL